MTETRENTTHDRAGTRAARPATSTPDSDPAELAIAAGNGVSTEQVSFNWERVRFRY